jgi:ABC-type amino acid transport system permease subunit
MGKLRIEKNATISDRNYNKLPENSMESTIRVRIRIKISLIRDTPLICITYIFTVVFFFSDKMVSQAIFKENGHD